MLPDRRCCNGLAPNEPAPAPSTAPDSLFPEAWSRLFPYSKMNYTMRAKQKKIVHFPRKTVEREARRIYVLDAARRLLATRDIEKTSMDEIAVAADYTRRTLYAYFKSRDEILLLSRRLRLHQQCKEGCRSHHIRADWYASGL